MKAGRVMGDSEAAAYAVATVAGLPTAVASG
jgi:hypothetical protein